MKFIKKDFYQEIYHIIKLIIVKEKLININIKNIFSALFKVYYILKLFM